VARRQRELSAGGTLDFRAEDRRRSGRTHPGGLRRRPRPGRPPGGDHRADDRKMTITRSPGAKVCSRTSRTRTPRCGTNDHRPAQPEGRTRPEDRLTSDEGQVLPAAAGGELATIVSGRAAGTLTRSTCWWTASEFSASLFDFRAVLLPLRAAQWDAGAGPYFYLPRWRATWRRGSERTPSSWPRIWPASPAAPSGLPS